MITNEVGTIEDVRAAIQASSKVIKLTPVTKTVELELAA